MSNKYNLIRTFSKFRENVIPKTLFSKNETHDRILQKKPTQIVAEVAENKLNNHKKH